MPRPRINWWLISPIILLLSIGLVVLRGVAPQFFTPQLIFVVSAVIVFCLGHIIGFRIALSLQGLSYIISILFLILPFLIGFESRGAHRWIQLGSFSLQPSELIKPFLLLTFIHWATSSSSYRLPLLMGSLTLPATIIFFQPDLGTTLVLLAGWFTILLSQVPLKIVLSFILALTFLAVPIYHYVLFDYQKARLTTFVDPFADPQGQGYHIIQSLIATGSGGLFGRGLGQGSQSNLRFLPERHTDFIFASLSESFGFLGSSVVIILYLILFWRIYLISQTTHDPQASLFCLSAVSMLAFQATVNMGMNIGLAPITGITLPFLSYGGSSLLSIAFTLGLIHSISMSPQSSRHTV